MKKNINLSLFALFGILFFIFGWITHSAYTKSDILSSSSLLDKIKKEGVLNVVLLNAATTYYIGTDGPQGFEYDLLNAYAKHLGVTLKITSANTVKEAIELSKNSDIHITSAALAKTEIRKKSFNFGPSYFEVQEQVVCNRSMMGTNKFPRDVEGLSGLNVTVGDETSYSETIKSLQTDGFDINATYTSEFSTEELLEKVSTHEIDCTIADSNIYSQNLRYFPEIALAFTIGPREQLAWVLRDDSRELESDMYAWLNNFSQSGAMTELKDHHYGYAMLFDYSATTMLYKQIKSTLPKYKDHFVDAANKNDIPWALLAAISYQESHWNPDAKSMTGVRGLMMLTQNTADVLGVQNRSDPHESVFGGAKYIKQMIKGVPEEVEGENRLKFALAAYNIGMGHILDAQELAKKAGLNQNIWTDLKKVLPLLSQKKYSKTLKYGYARGSEPVKYVDAIYNYKDIIEKTIEDSQLAEKKS
ncbi:MAG: membrane-bound lytic murein transglycosylase MltF [Sulfurimonas sp.]|jgi:membrane-bound lytic murein transglycosylase F